MARKGFKGKRQKSRHYKKNDRRPVQRKPIRYAKFQQKGYRVECWIIFEGGKSRFSVKIFSLKTKALVKEVVTAPLEGEVSFGWNFPLGISVDDHEDLLAKVEETLKDLPDLNKSR